MPEISKQALKVENNQSFPNNNVGEITPAILRTFNVNMIDSNVNQSAYTSDSGSWNNSINLINQFTASISASVNLSYLNQATASLQQFSASAKIQLANLETTSASVNISVANLNIYTASAGNSILQLNAFTASANQRLTSIESVSGSWITESETGSFAILGANNTFTGTTNTFNNVNVLGTLTAVTASFQYTTSSVVIVGQNKIVLNTDTPAVRFGGISVQDSGSIGNPSGSLYWDSQNNKWIYQHPSGSGEGYNSALLISGPANTGSLGSEVGLTAGYLQLATDDDHIGNSIVSQSVGSISIAGGLNLTGLITGSQITGYNTFTASTLTRLSTLEVETSNLETFSASALIRLSNIETTTASLNTSVANINLATASLQGQLTTIGSISGSWVTESETGSFARVNTTNSFTGSQIFSGSLIITGSAYGNVAAITVAASTASIDFSLANFFTLAIPTATTTRVVATNIRPGQTVSLLITQPATTGSLSFDTTFDFPNGFAYTPTAISGAKDIVTFVTFDSAIAYGTSAKNLI
jgi:hypothetical protein